VFSLLESPLPWTPLPWIPANANVSRDRNTPVRLNEEYSVTCNDGFMFYDVETGSFIGKLDDHFSSVTVTNVVGKLEITVPVNQNADGTLEHVICKAGRFMYIKVRMLN